jgi:diacylglycerol O-acyltransferase
MDRLSPIDAGFLITESAHSPKHVGSLQVLGLPKGKGPAWLRRMLDDLKQVRPGFPFDRRLLFDRPLQPALIEDDRFDIDYHVRHSVLPAPGDDRQLENMVARLHANLLDRDRPLWEFHLIEGLRDRRFAFYTKVHHCIVDGATFTRWFVESGSKSPAAKNSHPVWQRSKQPQESSADSTLLGRLTSGVTLLTDGVRTAVDLSALGARLVKQNILSSDRNAVLPLGAGKTALNVPTGAARSLAIGGFPLEEMRAIAHAEGASLNDLVMTLCDLSVYRYLAERRAAPSDPLVAYMPVDLRQNGAGDGNVTGRSAVLAGGGDVAARRGTAAPGPPAAAGHQSGDIECSRTAADHVLQGRGSARGLPGQHVAAGGGTEHDGLQLCRHDVLRAGGRTFGRPRPPAAGRSSAERLR